MLGALLCADPRHATFVDDSYDQTEPATYIGVCSTSFSITSTIKHGVVE
jgi:hypothetical protein